MIFRTGLMLAFMVWTSAAVAADVLFHWFDYTGQDGIFAEPLPDGEYQNPVVAGFFPDPSITRVGKTYYMVHSSYAYSPGFPLLKSTDLVTWQFVGHVLTRASQLNIQRSNVSGGLWAPTIRYHNGIFYLIAAGNDKVAFMVTATDPEGEWSDPVFLPELYGVHPDIFFDTDGKVYITHRGPPKGEPLYNGHKAIWMWEFDLKAQKVIADSGRIIVNGGADISKKPLWVEGPHIYKVGEWYYLLCAEGGTGDWHSEVVFRTKSLKEAFVPYLQNPILTQRMQPADRVNPVVNVGHADLVQTEKGEWWAVFLGSRTYDAGHFNTGRETYLLPVSWVDDWPVILNKGSLLPYRMPAPKGLSPTQNSEPLTGNFSWRDNFDSEQLNPHWSMLRVADAAPYRLISGGGITLEPRTEALSGAGQPAFLGRRQQHQQFTAETEFQIPRNPNILAGITAFYNEQSLFFMAVRRESDTQLQLVLELAKQSAVDVVAKSQIAWAPGTKTIVLGVEGTPKRLGFYWLDKEGVKRFLSKNEAPKILSTRAAGGFLGTQLGIHVRLQDSVQ